MSIEKLKGFRAVALVNLTLNVENLLLLSDYLLWHTFHSMQVINYELDFVLLDLPL